MNEVQELEDQELNKYKADLEFQTKLWEYADLLRSSHNLSNDDFHIVFLLISLHNDNLINVARKLKSHKALLDIISQDSFYSKFSTFYEKTLITFSLSDINKIIAVISGINPEEFRSNFKDIFEFLLKMSTDMQFRSSGNSLLQSEVAWFMNEMAGLGKSAEIFNPFSGYASFGLHRSKDQHYLAHEINKKIWVISLLRLKAHKKHENQDISVADTFVKWPENKKFDLVISNPPFGLRLPKQIKSSHKTVEQYVFLEGLKLLSSNGKLITTVPLRFLNDQRENETIKYLINQDVIEAVITFPGGLLMHTQIPFAIIMINKNKVRRNEVAFFHGSEFVTELGRNQLIFYPEGLLEEMELLLNPNNDNPDLSHIPEGYLLPEFIGNEKISDNNYSLDVKRYWLSNEEGTSIKDLIKPEPTIAFRKVLKSKGLNLETISGGENTLDLPHISTKDLKNDYKDYKIDLSTIQSKKLKTGRFIEKDVYLVSLLGKNLKPSFIKLENNNLFGLSSDLFSFSIDENLVDARWLIMELSSDKVKDKLNLLSSGVIPRIRKEDFLNLKINLPSLKEQKKEINRLLNLEKQVDELESDIIEQDSYLRHTVAGPLSDLDHALNSIDNILRKISKNEMPEILSKKISNDHLYTLGEYLEDSKNYIAVINSTVTNKLNSSQNIEQKQLNRINLFEHIMNYANRKNEAIKTQDYSIKFDYDGDFFNNKVNTEYKYILGNAELINTLLDNMIDNAVKHAFTEGEHNNIELYLWGEDGGNLVCFSVSNTGKTLSKGTKLKDLRRKGFRDSSKEGDGFGLWFVNEVVRKHNAEWFLINELWDEYPLQKDSNLFNFNNKRFNIKRNKKHDVYNKKTQFNIQLDKTHYVTKFSFHFPIHTN